MTKYFKERGNKLYRFLDKYVGIPLVAAAGLLLKRRVRIPATIKRIGIAKTACIGDTILLDGVSKDLREAWPEAEQVFFAGRDNYQMAKMLEEIDEVILLPMDRPWIAAKRIYEAGCFDLWLDFSQWARIDALLTLTARSTCKIGFMTPRQYRHYGYDIYIEHRNDVHELENYRNLIRAAGIKPEALPVLVKNSHTGSSINFLLNKPYIVIHMFPGGSMAHMKEWPEEQWLRVAYFCLNEGWAVALTGGPGDFTRAQDFTEKLKGKGAVINLAGSLRLQQLPILLANAALVVSVDTGVMHIAAAVGARMIAIHGPTSPRRWGPLSPRAKVIEPENMSCAPCLHLGFEYNCDANYCLKFISAQVVIDTIRTELI
jgi:ADP-heptose:LPS heptosyltransferase